MLRLNSRLGPGGEEPFDSFVSKPFDRHAYECNLYGYRVQPARPAGPGVRELRSMDRCTRMYRAGVPRWQVSPNGTSGQLPDQRRKSCPLSGYRVIRPERRMRRGNHFSP